MKRNRARSLKTLASVLIKPAGPDCNLACAYCFYREKSGIFPATTVHRMSEEVLEETIRQVLDQPMPAVSIGWQGGEPTLMGLDFFEKRSSSRKNTAGASPSATASRRMDFCSTGSGPASSAITTFLSVCRSTGRKTSTTATG